MANYGARAVVTHSHKTIHETYLSLRQKRLPISASLFHHSREYEHQSLVFDEEIFKRPSVTMKLTKWLPTKMPCMNKVIKYYLLKQCHSIIKTSRKQMSVIAVKMNKGMIGEIPLCICSQIIMIDQYWSQMTKSLTFLMASWVSCRRLFINSLTVSPSNRVRMCLYLGEGNKIDKYPDRSDLKLSHTAHH